jgi:tetratricopeptide (TPR) repeat protein
MGYNMSLKRLIVFLVFLFISLRGIASSFPDSILFKSYAQQYHFRNKLLNETFKDIAPNKLVSIFTDLANEARQKDDVPLYYGFLITRDKVIIERDHPDTLATVQELINMLPQLENDRLYELKAEALRFISTYYWNKKKYPLAFEYSTYAYNAYNKYSIEEFPSKAECLLNFGGSYFYFKDYTTAAYYILQGYNANPNEDKGYIFTLLNTLSLCYLRSDKLDSAEYFLNKGYALAEKKGERIWVGIISGNLGMLCFKRHRYEDAMKWFEKEIEACKGKAAINIANTLAVKAEINIAWGNKEEALKLINKAYDILKGEENYTRKYEINREIYLRLSRIYAAVGNMELAYKFLDSATVAKDTVDKRTNALILSGIQHKISANDRLMAQERFEKDAQNNKIIRYVLIAGIVLLLITTVLFINRQRLKYSFSRKQLEAEKKHIESELEIATKQLGTLVTSISDKNEIIEKFTSELDRLREHLSVDKLSKADETLSELQKTTVITDEEWNHFLATFEKVHKGFVARLAHKIKGLSPIETKFVMLSKLKLSTKEVASALGISPEAVRLNRKRLYAKLGLTEGEHSLQTLIDSI